MPLAIRFLAALAFLVLGLAPAAAAETRFALVVGNSAYATAGRLPNAGNDARLVAAAFEAMGFEVAALYDLDEAAMGKALDDLAKKAGTLDVAAVYFAGHGIQKDGRNFLIPVDASLRSPTADERETIALDSLMEALEQVPISLVFLDACRNNPFAEALMEDTSAGGRTANVKRGLAVVRTKGDMLVTFATLPNSVASDGAEGNSPFARALARHIKTPDTEVSVLMKRVTRDVMDETRGEQRPQQLSQMQTEFYFKKTSAAPTVDTEAKTLLAVYPGKVKTGEEISVLADVPHSCSPSFLNLTPSSKATPIPTQFFKTVDLGNGQYRYEISPGSRYGLVVQDQDERGQNRIGFFCEPAGLAEREDKIELLRALSDKLAAGELAGTLSAPRFGDVAYRFADFVIE